jgi:hypothetical protein
MTSNGEYLATPKPPGGMSKRDFLLIWLIKLMVEINKDNIEYVFL